MRTNCFNFMDVRQCRQGYRLRSWTVADVHERRRQSIETVHSNGGSMALKERERRYNERWVNCAAADAAYEQVRTLEGGEFKKLTELGRGLLSRIRGRGEKHGIQATTLMQFQSVKDFAEDCGVAVETLLANGDGLYPLRLPAPAASVARQPQQCPPSEIASRAAADASGVAAMGASSSRADERHDPSSRKPIPL